MGFRALVTHGSVAIDYCSPGFNSTVCSAQLQSKKRGLHIADTDRMNKKSNCKHPPFGGSCSGHTLKSIGYDTPANAHPFWAIANVHETTWVEPDQYIQGQGGGATYNR